MQVENYKLNNLVGAVDKIKQLPGLSYNVIFAMAKVVKFGQEALKPFFVTIEEIKKEHPQKKGEDGKPVFVPIGNGQMRPEFEDEEAMQTKMTEISNQKTDFVMEKFEINYGKDEKWLTLELVKTFMDVFGDEFVVTEI